MKKTNPNLRRIIAVLIAMMLLVTSVVTVYGEGTSCTHENTKTVSQGKYTRKHDLVCIDCNVTVYAGLDCYEGNVAGQCRSCGASMYRPVCDHVGSRHTVKDNGDGTHTSYCEFCEAPRSTVPHSYNTTKPSGECTICGHVCDHEGNVTYKITAKTHHGTCQTCGKKVTFRAETHNFVNGVCTVCGYGESEHEHDYIAYSDNKGNHTLRCNCGAAYDPMKCSDGNGDSKCDSCGYVMYVAPVEPHEHNYVAHSNNDGTHNLSCNCGLEVTMACYDADGDDFCDACGDLIRAFHKCTFEAGVTSNEDGTHNINCKCGAFVTVTCLDNDGDRFCDSCGYEKYAPVEGEHEHNYVAHSNNDGTHNLSCNCGLEVKNVTCLDNDGDRYCDSCGYEKYAPVEDNHEHNYVAHSNNDGTHNLSCNCGKEVKNVTCLDSDGDRYCDSCGYEKYAPVEGEHEHNYVAHSNDNGTHNLSCNCGLEVKNITCLDNDGDRFCDSCGYEKYLPVVEDHEHNYVAHSNNDGTHNLSCNCGLEVKNVTCLDNDGDRFCDSCGYEKYLPVVDPEDPTVDPEDPTVDPEDPTVDPEDPTVDPEDPAEDDSDETEKDSEEKTTDVPKTGDSRSSMMMTLLAASIVLMGAAMVTAAAYFKAGKNRR